MENEVFLYIVTTGWKTGRKHEIEIWFVEHDGCYYVIGGQRDNAHWLQNIRHTASVLWMVGTRADRAAAGDKLASGTGWILDESTDAPLIDQVKALMLAKYRWNDGTVLQLRPNV